MSYTPPHKKRRKESSVRMEDGILQLANSIRRRIKDLPPLSTNCCIYKIPRTLRNANVESYEPYLISIGPFHFGIESVQGMQEQKLRYLQNFLRRNSENTLKFYLRAIKEWEEETREYYVDTINLGSNDFVEMVFLDACFVIEFFLNWYWETLDENDRIFGKPSLEYVIRRDLLLLENQLPFFVIQGLYDLVFDDDSCQRFIPFIDLTCEVLLGKTELPTKLTRRNVLHFVDFMRTFLLPDELRDPTYARTQSADWDFCPGVGDLHNAGVKFVASQTDTLLDMKFENGVLEIPKLEVEDHTESLLLNLSAFEQCHYHSDSYIVDYILLMDVLITTLKDVDILMNSGIVSNSLGSKDDVARVFNTICKEATYEANKFYYSDLCKRLLGYSQQPWNRWKATLKHDYFSNPWTIISAVAAVVLLVLTVVQTICGVMAYQR